MSKIREFLSLSKKDAERYPALRDELLTSQFFETASDEDVMRVVDQVVKLESSFDLILDDLVKYRSYELLKSIYRNNNYPIDPVDWVGSAIINNNYRLFAEMMKDSVENSYDTYNGYFFYICGHATSPVFIMILDRMQPGVTSSPAFFYLVTQYGKPLEYLYLLKKHPNLEKYVDITVDEYDFKEARLSNPTLVTEYDNIVN